MMKFANSGLINIKGKSGVKRCVIIPVDDNGLYVGEKGVYAGFVAWENIDEERGRTHLVKQSLSKEQRDMMSDNELRQLPIFGECSDMSPAQMKPSFTVEPDSENELPF